MTTKSKFIKFYAERNNLENLHLAEEKMDKFIGALKKALSQEERLVFKGFGIFEVRKTTERDICDARGNKNIIHAVPRKYVKFIVSKTIQDTLCLKEKEI